MSNSTKKAPHRVLRIIGILLLLLLLLVGGCIFALKTDTVSIDDPAALAAQAPMAASRRFVFHAAEETARISLDKSDLWWLLLPEMEEDLLETVNRELEKYQLSLNGYGLDITEKGLYIDLEAMYQSVRLPVHILTELEFDQTGVTVTLTKAKLGPVTIPTAGLLRNITLRLDVDWPVVTDITQVTYRQNAVVLTGTLTQDMLSCARETGKKNAIGWFCPSHQEVFHAARTEDGYKTLLPGLEQDPGSVEALYHDLFTMIQEHEYEAYMQASKNLPQRFFPGIDFAAWETENAAVRAQWEACDALVDQLVTQIARDFNNRRFKLRDGGFYRNGAEFDVLNYFSGDAALEIEQLFQIIDPDSFRLILVGSINGYAKESPVLSWICGKEQQLTRELNRAEAYPVGCVFRGRNGEYFLRYESMQILEGGGKTAKLMKTVPLSEAEYDSLLQEGKIGVWIS